MLLKVMKVMTSLPNLFYLSFGGMLIKIIENADGACSNIAYKVLFAQSLDALTFGDQVEEEGEQR